MERIIQSKRSVIVAADVPTNRSLENLMQAVKDVPGIGGVKLGFASSMQSLARAVHVVRRTLGPNFPIIYDHQKAGNDIPDTGKIFARILRDSGVNVAILFPFAGPVTQEAWTHACLNEGLQVITGGIMTHSQFAASEGGYIADNAVEEIYRNACAFGCSHFVVPGTKLDWVKRIRGWLVEKLGEGNFVLYAPGFIKQGGDISECGAAAGDEWHAIVGSAIYDKPTKSDQRNAAIAVTRQIVTVPA